MTATIPPIVILKRTISQHDVDKFAEISGDYNALHVDQNFARKTKFGQRIVHGMLLASFFSQVVGMHLHTQNVVYLSQSLNFKNPVYIGDEVAVVFQLKGFSESTRTATFETKILKGKLTCVEGEAKVYIT